MSMPSKKLFLFGLAALLLAGCATFEEVGKKIADSQAKADEAMVEQNKMRRTGAVVRMSGAKLAGEEVSVKQTGQLPPLFSRSFSYLSAHQPLSAVLGEISRRAGVGTAIQPADPTTTTARTTAAAAPGMPSFSGGQDTPIAVDWNGDLKGLLDYLAATTQMFWKYEDGRIYFFRTETRSFNVLLPGGKRTVKSSISLAGISGSGGGGNGNSGNSGGGSSGGGTSGSSEGGSSGTVDVASTMEIDAYEAVIKSVQAIVSAAEGVQPTAAGASSGSTGTTASSKNVVANPALGIITVTGTPAILDRVASYMKSINERFAQNVMIGVKIYSLSIDKSVDASASLAIAYQDAGKKYGISVGSVRDNPSAKGNNNSLIINSTGGSWKNTSLLLDALQSIGDVQYVTSGQVIAANGQPSPLQVVNNMSYLQAVTTSIIQGAGASTGYVPGTVTTGFTANFLPLILGDNRILLQYQINLSQLLSIDKFPAEATPKDVQIQLPNVATQSLQQQAFVKDGQSIVLFGFEQNRAEAKNTAGLLSYGKLGISQKTMLVIVMEVFSGK